MNNWKTSLLNAARARELFTPIIEDLKRKNAHMHRAALIAHNTLTQIAEAGTIERAQKLAADTARDMYELLSPKPEEGGVAPDSDGVS
jgi:hypothetical protein